MSYRRLATDRSLTSAASIDAHASAINTHAARPVYQMRVSIMRLLLLLTKLTPQTSSRRSAVLGSDGGFSFADLRHPLRVNPLSFARERLPSTSGCAWMASGPWGISSMRILGIVALCAALGGCQTDVQAPV